MSEEFELEVAFNNQTLLLPLKLIPYGYTYKLEVIVNNTPFYFERDEERNWRAIVNEEELKEAKQVSKELLQKIAETINIILG